MREDTERSGSNSEQMIPGVRLPSGVITPGKRSRRSLRLRNAIVASSFELTGKRVLDVGCAEGRTSLHLAGRAQEVLGIDHRASEIDIARNTAAALGIANARFEAGDIRDPDLFAGAGRFDLAIAWGFLHRIGDIFGLVYALEPIADAISLEWRTPVVPLMSELSIAYHPAGAKELDPMNTGRPKDGSGTGKIKDQDKIEGDASFWEPTPGAVKAILARLGYTHATLLGYEEKLVSQEAIMKRWRDYEAEVKAGTRKATDWPQARVHMLFEKRPGSIRMADMTVARGRLPAWDEALIESTKSGRHPAKSGSRPRTTIDRVRRVAASLFRRVGLGRAEAGARSKRARKGRTSDPSDRPARPPTVDEATLHGEIRAQAPLVVDDALAYADGDPKAVGGAGIQLFDIDRTNLTVVTYTSTQLAMRLASGRPLPRAIFRDDRHFYKIWRHDYVGHRDFYIGENRVVLPIAVADGVERLWAFHLGLFDIGLCPAFAGGIYNGTKLVGYRTTAGKLIDALDPRLPNHAEFIERLKENTLKSGVVYSDVRTANIVELPDGRLSLIDFDGYLLPLREIPSKLRITRGSIRPRTVAPYREFLTRYASPRPWDLSMRGARRSSQALPPLVAAAIEARQRRKGG